MDVRPVASWGDLRAFVDLPYRLHAGTPWVPPLRLERYLFLSRRANAYFTHGTARYLLARRGGRVVGRMSVQADHAFNAFHGSRTAHFGFLELEDDPEVLPALLAAGRDWARARGCNRLVGPMDLSMNDESGILVAGFDRRPLVKQPWHPPYYAARAEEAGLVKAMDLFSWWLDVSDRDRVRPTIWRVAERARTRHGIVVRPMSRLHLRRELDAFAEIYNAAWAQNWGFVPYGKADLDAYALELQLVYSPGWFMVAELDGEPIAMAISVLDVTVVPTSVFIVASAGGAQPPPNQPASAGPNTTAASPPTTGTAADADDGNHDARPSVETRPPIDVDGRADQGIAAATTDDASGGSGAAPVGLIVGVLSVIGLGVG